MTARLLSPLLHWWDALDELGRRQAWAVALCMSLFLVHYFWYSHWYIEDAAISFSYARNLATGEGFASYPGGEPVEGFSNPTWTLALAVLHLVGINPFIGGKLLGAIFGLVGVWFTFRWSREVLGKRQDLAAVLAPLLLVLSPQYVAWAAGGLENSIVALTMAGGGASLLAEVRERRAIPWSGLWWSVLAISRPEAPAYAAVAGLAGFITISARRGPRAAVDWAWRWGLVAAGPFFAWHAFEYLHFAWSAPNTYYAKLHDGDRFRPWIWSGKQARSWGYVRRFALWYGHGFLLWLYIWGQTGLRGLRPYVGAAIAIAVYVVVIPGLVWTWAVWGEIPLEGWIPALGEEGFPVWPFAADPDWLVSIRVVMLAAIAVFLPAVGFGRVGQAGRLLALWLVAFVVFFSLYAGGDWMDGMRWFNLCIVPLCVLIADAIVELYDALRRRWPRGYSAVAGAFVPFAVVGGLNVYHTVELIRAPDTPPYSVARRVQYMSSVAERLDLDHTTWMDVDMGAHMWWPVPHIEIVDMAGLIDVPMGHHRWERPFVREYVYEERNPDFAHVHGNWASKTRMRSHKPWRDYLEIPPFPVSSRKHHVGSHVRKDLIFPGEWDGESGREVAFQGGITLAGWTAPAPVVAPGEELFVEVGLKKSFGMPDPRPVLILAGHGRVVTKELPPAHDWLSVKRWKKGDVARMVYRLTLPDDLPLGEYDLGFAVLHASGVRQPLEVPTGATVDAPVFARGEVRWPGAIEVGDDERVDQAADAGLARVLGPGGCDDRLEIWRDVRNHRPIGHRWRVRADQRVRGALADCYGAWLDAGFEAGVERSELVRRGVAGRHQDFNNPTLRRAAKRVARTWREESRAAEAAGDIDRAYALARDGLRLRPYAAWERKRAERLRDIRLEIDTPPTLAERILGRLGLGTVSDESGAE